MTGEDFFKFNKSNEFRFSNYKEIKEEDLKGADEKTKKLFNIFAGEDKILQEVEAKSLFNVLKTVAGDNQILEENEIKAFAKEHIGEEVDTNIFTAFVNNLFGTKDKTQNQPVQVAQNNGTSKTQQTFLEEAACKEIVIDIIDENLSEAYEILNSQYLGSISGWHDERKDKNDILKTSNVSKVLDYQNAGIEWMNKAKIAPPNGLTKKEYYEGNKQRIKDMILTRILVLDTNSKFAELKNKYSEEKLAEIIGDYVEQLCSNASIEDLKDMQKQFVSYSGVGEIQALENVIDNAIKFNADKNKPVPCSEIPLPKFDNSKGIIPLPKFDNSKGIIPEYWNSDEPISFEEVYKIERGTEYSQYKIEQYALAKKEMEVVANAYNKKQQFIEFAEGLRKDETLSIDEKAQKVLEGFATFYALSEDGGLTQLKELVAQSKLPISVDENGFNFGTLDDSAKNRALNSLLKLAKQSKEKEFEEFLNGKTIEDYQIALAQAHDDAIGEENGKLMAEAMKNDNLTYIQRWTGNTSMVGMGMTIVGGILCFTPLAPLGAGMVTVGNTLAIGGMVAKTGLGVTDYATKDVQTAEEAEQLTKDFIMDAGGFIIGMGAGKAGLKAFSKLIDKKLVAVFGQQIASGNKAQALKTVFTNPEYLKSFMTAAGAKLSTDFLISYAGDLAMMGILDTQDDWQSLLKANLTGILVGMSGDIKDVSGVGRVRNLGISDGVKPMTEMDYGQRLFGNDVKVTDPSTGVTLEGTVTGLHNTNGQVEIEVNGQRFSTNDVAEVRGEAKKADNTPLPQGARLEQYFKPNDFVFLRGLLDIKAQDPLKFNRISSSGIFDLIKEGKISAIVMNQLGLNADLSPDMYSDLKLLKEGKSIVTEFAENTAVNEAFQKTKIGDAVEIGKKMYLNDGNRLIEWNMTKEKYLELFPPVQRFATVQGAIGDCHLIQSLGLAMHNPKARVQFLQSFSMKGNDVIVTVKGLEDYRGSKTFKNGTIKLAANGKHCIGCIGMQMYEQTYATVALRENVPATYPNTSSIDDIMIRTIGGQGAQTMADMFGQGHVADIIRAKKTNGYFISSFALNSFASMPYNKQGKTVFANLNEQNKETTKLLVFNKFFTDYPNKALTMCGLDLKTTETLLSHAANNQDYIISFGTIPKGTITESSLLPEYNLVSKHAYSILGYNKTTQMVKIGNPHSYAETTEIPLSILHQYIQHIDFLKL